MAAYLVGSIINAHLPAARGRDDQPPEHRCATCYGPFGKSAIRCPNEPLTPVERAMAWVAKRAETASQNRAALKSQSDFYREHPIDNNDTKDDES